MLFASYLCVIYKHCVWEVLKKILPLYKICLDL